MKNLLLRFVALLLGPCFIVDPAAAALFQPIQPVYHSICSPQRFEQEAIVSPIIEFLHFILHQKRAPHEEVQLLARETISDPASLQNTLLPSVEIIQPERLVGLDIQATCFDFDDTLWIGFPTDLEALIAARWLYKKRRPTPEEIEGIRLMIVETTGSSWQERIDSMRRNGRTFVQAEVDAFTRRRRRAVDRQVRRQNLSHPRYLMPGSVELLEDLQHRRQKIAILTGGTAESRTQYAVELGIHHFFDPILGGGNKAVHLGKLANEWGLQSKQLALLGDGTRDMQAAREAGALAVGIARTPEDRARLIRAGADVIVNRDLSDVQTLTSVLFEKPAAAQPSTVATVHSVGTIVTGAVFLALSLWMLVPGDPLWSFQEGLVTLGIFWLTQAFAHEFIGHRAYNEWKPGQRIRIFSQILKMQAPSRDHDDVRAAAISAGVGVAYVLPGLTNLDHGLLSCFFLAGGLILLSSMLDADPLMPYSDEWNARLAAGRQWKEILKKMKLFDRLADQAQTDTRALVKNWQVIGDVLQNAIGQVEEFQRAMEQKRQLMLETTRQYKDTIHARTAETQNAFQVIASEHALALPVLARLSFILDRLANIYGACYDEIEARIKRCPLESLPEYSNAINPYLSSLDQRLRLIHRNLITSLTEPPDDEDVKAFEQRINEEADEIQRQLDRVKIPPPQTPAAGAGLGKGDDPQPFDPSPDRTREKFQWMRDRTGFHGYTNTGPEQKRRMIGQDDGKNKNHHLVVTREREDLPAPGSWPNLLTFSAGMLLSATAGYAATRLLLDLDAKLAALPSAPFRGLHPGDPAIIEGGRIRQIEQTANGALVKYSVPPVVRAMVFMAPGKMASMEPAHGLAALQLHRPGPRRAKLRQLWHLDDNYYLLPGGLAYAIEQAYPEAGIALLSSVDEYNPQVQLKMTRQQHAARTTEAIQAVRARYPGVPIILIGSSMGGLFLLEHLGTSEHSPEEFPLMIVLNAALELAGTGVRLAKYWQPVLARSPGFGPAAIATMQSLLPGSSLSFLQDLEQRLHARADGSVSIFIGTLAEQGKNALRENDGFVNPRYATGHGIEHPELYPGARGLILDRIYHGGQTTSPLIHQFVNAAIGAVLRGEDPRHMEVLVNGVSIGRMGDFAPAQAPHIQLTDQLDFRSPATVTSVDPAAPASAPTREWASTGAMNSGAGPDLLPWNAARKAILKSGMMGSDFLDYAEAQRNVINPNSDPLVVAVGGAGPVVSDVLMATHFTKAYFVDNEAISLDVLRKWHAIGVYEPRTSYREKAVEGYAHEYAFRGYREFYSLAELASMGVRGDDILEISSDEQNRPRILFRLPGDPQPREIIFVHHSLEVPDARLNQELAGTIDVYYQKGVLSVPQRYRTSLPDIASWVKLNGMMALNNFTPDETFCDPQFALGPAFRSLEDFEQRTIDLARHIALSHPDRMPQHYGWYMQLYRKTADRSSSEIPREVTYSRTLHLSRNREAWPAAAGRIRDVIRQELPPTALAARLESLAMYRVIQSAVDSVHRAYLRPQVGYEGTVTVQWRDSLEKGVDLVITDNGARDLDRVRQTVETLYGRYIQPLGGVFQVISRDRTKSERMVWEPTRTEPPLAEPYWRAAEGTEYRIHIPAPSADASIVAAAQKNPGQAAPGKHDPTLYTHGAALWIAVNTVSGLRVALFLAGGTLLSYLLTLPRVRTALAWLIDFLVRPIINTAYFLTANYVLHQLHGREQALLGLLFNSIWAAKDRQYISEKTFKTIGTGLGIFYLHTASGGSPVTAMYLAVGSAVGAWFESHKLPSLAMFGDVENLQDITRRLADFEKQAKRYKKVFAFESAIFVMSLLVSFLGAVGIVPGKLPFYLHPTRSLIELSLGFLVGAILWTLVKFFSTSGLPWRGLPHPPSTTFRTYLERVFVILAGSAWNWPVTLPAILTLVWSFSSPAALPFVYNILNSRTDWISYALLITVLSLLFANRFSPTISVAIHEGYHHLVQGSESMAITIGDSGATTRPPASPIRHALASLSGAFGSLTLASMLGLILTAPTGLPEPQMLGSIIFAPAVAIVAISVYLIFHAFYVAILSIHSSRPDSLNFYEEWAKLKTRERIVIGGVSILYLGGLILIHPAVHASPVLLQALVLIAGSLPIVIPAFLAAFLIVLSGEWMWWTAKQLIRQLKGITPDKLKIRIKMFFLPFVLVHWLAGIPSGQARFITTAA